MKSIKLIILPKLNDAGEDLSKKWFVYYSVRDPRTNKMQRFKEYDGLSSRDEDLRRIAAARKIESLTIKLKNGWSPFNDDSEAVYEDQLQYRTITELYANNEQPIRPFDFTLRNILRPSRKHPKTLKKEQ